MRAHSTRRAFWARRGDRVVASHGFLEPIAEAMAADRRDYHQHRAVFVEVGVESEHLLTAFIHKTVRGQAAGGVRFWPYATIESLFRDGLRLARGMGHKNALAGLWWGGGKGVIARRPDVDHRNDDVRRGVYRDYGRFITGLRGCYVTAEDAGTTAPDMARIFETTRHTTCIPPTVGGSGNPSVLTAAGVVVAMEAGLHATGRGSLEGKIIVSEGLGNVARHMVGPLLDRGVARIIAADIDRHAIELAREMHPDARLDARLVEANDRSILFEQGDILAPNALGASLCSETIPRIAAPLVCGAANNQLADPERDAIALAARSIVYVPDFLANRMGIVNCANEQYGRLDDDPAILAHLSRDAPFGIFCRVVEVLRRSEASKKTPAAEAEQLAEELSNEPHPLWNDRGQQIIDALIDGEWISG